MLSDGTSLCNAVHERTEAGTAWRRVSLGARPLLKQSCATPVPCRSSLSCFLAGLLLTSLSDFCTEHSSCLTHVPCAGVCGQDPSHSEGGRRTARLRDVWQGGEGHPVPGEPTRRPHKGVLPHSPSSGAWQQQHLQHLQDQLLTWSVACLASLPGPCSKWRDVCMQGVRPCTRFACCSSWCPLQGCGIVTMAGHQEAAAAIEALDKLHRFAGSDSAMVAKWVDQQLQQTRPRRSSEAGSAGSPAGETHPGSTPASGLLHRGVLAAVLKPAIRAGGISSYSRRCAATLQRSALWAALQVCRHRTGPIAQLPSAAAYIF